MRPASKLVPEPRWNARGVVYDGCWYLYGAKQIHPRRTSSGNTTSKRGFGPQFLDLRYVTLFPPPPPPKKEETQLSVVGFASSFYHNLLLYLTECYQDRKWPGRLSGHTATLWGDKMIIAGGEQEEHITTMDLWEYHFRH